MIQCPSCRREFKDDVRFCPYDGQVLNATSQNQPAREPVRADSLSGTTLNRRYRVEAKLHSHGPIVSYGGTDLQTKQPVLIKVLDTRQDASPSAERSFLDTARRLSEMRQAAILTVKNFAGPQAAGLPLAVLAFPAGITLKRRIDRDGPLDDAHAAVILRQVSWAVDALHAQNVFTRGWSPDNIWLNTGPERNDVVEMDCLWLPQSVDPTQPAARVAYLSPEECKGEQGDGRSDVYRLGLLAYEMITGSLPFQSDSASELMGLHLEEAPRPMDLVAGRPIQINVERAIMRALAKFPKYRQPSALEFARDLEAVELPSRPTTALPNIPFDATTGGVNPAGSRSTSLLQEAAFDPRDSAETTPPPKAVVPEQPEPSTFDEAAPTLEWKGPVVGDLPRLADQPAEGASSPPGETASAAGSDGQQLDDSEPSKAASTEPEPAFAESEAIDHDAITQPVVRNINQSEAEPQVTSEEEATAPGAHDAALENVAETEASLAPEVPEKAESPAAETTEEAETTPVAAEVPVEAPPVTIATVAESTAVAETTAAPSQPEPESEPPTLAGESSASPAEPFVQSEPGSTASAEPPVETVPTQEVPAAVTAPVGSQATMILSSEPAARANASQAAGPPLEQDAGPARPIYLDEKVQFTVFRPKVIQPLVWSTMIAFAHLSNRRPEDPEAMADPLQEVKRQAEHLLGKEIDQYKTVGADALQAFPGEGDISFVPLVPGVEFNPPRTTFRWEQGIHREEFRLRAATTLNGQVARGRLSVFLGTVLIGEVPLAINVDDRYVAQPAPAASSEATSASCYRKIFASYSQRDSMIAEQFERFAEANGDQYLRDIRDLRSGEVWGTRLEKAILEADVFQLFWSSNSMASPFVRREWEYALSLRRPNFVRPTYWEDRIASSDQHNLPPEELTRLHFQRIGYVATQSARVEAGETRTPTGPLASGRLSAMPTPVLPPVEPDPSRKPDPSNGVGSSADSRDAGEFEFNWTPPRDHSEPARAPNQSDSTAALTPAQQASTFQAQQPPPVQAPQPAPWQSSPPVPRPIPATAERPALGQQAQAQGAQRAPDWPPLPAYHSQPAQQPKPAAPSLAIRVIIFLLVGALFMLGFVYLLNRLWR